MSQQNLNAKNLIILIFAFVVSLTAFSFNAEAITLPFAQGEHPRIYIESSDVSALAARCSQAGEIKDIYDELFVLYERNKIPVYPTVERAARALGALNRRRRYLQEL